MKMRWDLGWMAAGVVGCALLVAQAQEPAVDRQGDSEDQAAAQVDPPSQVARLGVLFGNVSVEPASVDQFSAAEVNYPLTTGDRIYADTGANAELQTGLLAVRLGQATDLTVTAMTDTLAQFGLAQGSVHLRSFSLSQGATVEVDTPNVAVTVLQPGDVRVDVEPNADVTTIMVVSGQVQVDGNGMQQTLQAGQRVRLTGSDPVAAGWLYTGTLDGLDRFSSDRDAAYDSAMASEQQQVNPGTIGVEDLAGAGDWSATDGDDAGPIWYPAGVAVGWAPYSCGRWTWIAPWGWTWVGCERWGFAPFHYGRWQRVGGRWGWRPGPPVLRPIYSPALVAFVGGPGLAINGAGVTAWFPLGPRDPYVPWYHTSAGYLNRVNVSNIYDRNAGRARVEYSQRAWSPVLAMAADHVDANRLEGTTAVLQASFAAGKPVSQAVVRVSSGELAGAQILAHPMVAPQRVMVVSAPARALPSNIARPELATRVETGSRAPVDAQRAAPGSEMRQTPAVGERPGAAGSEGAPVVRSLQPQATRETQPREPPALTPAPAPVAQQPRQLFNKAVPPEPRPSFEQQQKAMESADPGRPLSPQQMQNVRQNLPVQPPPQREAVHPAPAQRPAPAARSAPPAPAPAPRKP
jgi:hypothetical protein